MLLGPLRILPSATAALGADGADGAVNFAGWLGRDAGGGSLEASLNRAL